MAWSHCFQILLLMMMSLFVPNHLVQSHVSSPSKAPLHFALYIINCLYKYYIVYDNNLYLSFLLFILALIRHNKPGIAAFRLGNGYSALKDALSSESVRFQR